MSKLEYQVLARKYRPQSFSQVVGQEAIVITLINAIRMQRIAHAYLFSGSRGTGKTTLARLFAKALNCSKLSTDGEPCNTCFSCKEIAKGQAIDVLEIDGASHRGIEDIRQINETIGFVPINLKYKIYLVDEVHMLTKEAFNALLKTLEEPPAHVKFFFATTEPHKIPMTVLSRCQRFNLRRIPIRKIQQKLEEIARDLILTVEEEALAIIAELSEGSMRDAESLFDQVIAYQNSSITESIVMNILGIPSRQTFFSLDEAGYSGDLTAAFRITEAIFDSGKNVNFFLEELIGHFRTLFLLKNKVPFQGNNQKKYQISVKFYRNDQLLEILELLTDAMQTLKFSICEKTTIEMLLLRILRTHKKISIDQLIERLITLESKITDHQKNTDTLPKPLQSTNQNTPSIQQSSIKTQQASSELESVKKQSRYDTLMRFAAKELNGAFKKE
ncbi:MAG: DNA polymerase III subunit gamma/tau [Chlamydiales bacterium]